MQNNSPNHIWGHPGFAAGLGLLNSPFVVLRLDGPHLQNEVIWAIQGSPSNSIIPFHQLVSKIDHRLSQDHQNGTVGLILILALYFSATLL